MLESRKVLAVVALLIIALPAAGFSRDRDRQARERHTAYSDGYAIGFREGFRHGEFDFRNHLSYDFRHRDLDRWGRGANWAFRFHGEYKKGYRDGYHKGYSRGYRPRGYPFGPHPQRRLYPF